MYEATLSCPDKNKFYIYFEHLVSQPMEVEPEQQAEPKPEEEPVVVTYDSSSDDGYESAEDEAYKPPSPGYETDSTESESPKRRSKNTKKKHRCLHQARRKCQKNGKKSSKRYTGRRRKRHGLYSESSKGNQTDTLASGLGAAQGPVETDMGGPVVVNEKSDREADSNMCEEIRCTIIKKMAKHKRILGRCTEKLAPAQQ
ncbi:hypothetical protein Ahy_A07g032998 [Arachis hypogaea]|uniref:Uncharacterized protein n=1 Tax=Arachis hypogaea TaxID=3818 RepID=A0A445C7Z5_ARAHY|nr:hypothetical protein Ahy_A07g032998 [Arachis hypogaea]